MACRPCGTCSPSALQACPFRAPPLSRRPASGPEGDQIIAKAIARSFNALPTDRAGVSNRAPVFHPRPPGSEPGSWRPRRGGPSDGARRLDWVGRRNAWRTRRVADWPGCLSDAREADRVGRDAARSGPGPRRPAGGRESRRPPARRAPATRRERLRRPVSRPRRIDERRLDTTDRVEHVERFLHGILPPIRTRPPRRAAGEWPTGRSVTSVHRAR